MSRALPKYSKAAAVVQSLIFGIAQGVPLTAFEAHTIKFTMPQRGKILGVRLNVGLRGGTFNVGTVDVKAAGTSILTAAFDVAALTPATPVDKEIADLSATGLALIEANTEMTIVVAVTTGTSPTWADVTVQIEYLPYGG